jgi:hypothetical protein
MTSKLFQAQRKTATMSAVQTKAAALQRTTARRSYDNSQSATETTDNGAPTYASTGSKVLDLFSKGGSMRSSSEADIEKIVVSAMKEEPALAAACLFWIRDVLEGQGERRFFRVALKVLCRTHPQAIPTLIPLIPQYGRWDDLFAFKGTIFYQDALLFYRKQLLADSWQDDNTSISLAAKWAPSESAGSKSKILWKDFVKLFDSPRSYRRLITALRTKLNVVETLMSQDRWNEIKFNEVPSRAALIYRKAFGKHQSDRYSAFITTLLNTPKEERTENIKSTTLYPYEIVHKALHNRDDRTLDALWEAMPDYLKGQHNNSLAVVDTSGSMTSPAYNGCNVTMQSVALSIGLYLADNAKGPWANQFITFSDNPEFQEVKGKTLAEKLRNMSRASWDMSTSLDKVFTEILKVAIKNELSQDDLPKTIFVISDMQFNHAYYNQKGLTTFEGIDKQFANAGYVRPSMIFWDVEGKAKDSPVKYNEYGVGLVSGFSANNFKLIMGDDTTPEEMMRNALESSRYEAVRAAFI